MAGVNYAQTTQRSAALHTDFARQFVERRWGKVVADALYAALPQYSRGPRRGMVKGYVHWTKCERGGWVRGGERREDGQAVGHVERPGVRDVRVRWTCDPLSAVLLEDPRNLSPQTTDDQRIRSMWIAIGNASTKRRYA